MIINRNNYEEYFLRYADNELSADEKSMVEIFVKQNSDLEEEFVMLQQSVVKPDNTITFENKSSLFRKEEFITQANYEEKFLLYADNELSLSQIEETEKFVLSNRSLQTEFSFLQQVKYEPDTSIVFPDKSLLYKKPDNSKIIAFNWRYLAAAVLLGIGLWAGMNFLQKDKTKPVIGTRPNTEIKNSIPVNPFEEKDEKDLVKTDPVGEQPLPAPEKKQPDNQVIKQQQDVVAKTIQPANIPEVVKLPEQIVKNDLPVKSNDLPGPITITSEATAKTITAEPTVQNNYAMPASYIAEEDDKSENYVFYNITTEEFKKSKVGKFIKKVKRAVERKIPFKNNPLRIGSVEIAKDIEN